MWLLYRRSRRCGWLVDETNVTRFIKTHFSEMLSCGVGEFNACKTYYVRFHTNIILTQLGYWPYTTRTSIITYSILIPSCVGGAGADPPTYKMRTFFLMPLDLSVSIFNKKPHRTRAVETFKIWPNFESFHSPMNFFVENWHIKSQRHKKSCPHFIRRRVRPCPTHTAGN